MISQNMDVFKIIISMFLVLFYAGVAYQKPHNGINHQPINITEDNNNGTVNITDAANATANNVDPKVVPVNTSCVTGFDVIGGCMRRKFCDYGTKYIDFTSYSKHGYKTACGSGDMVCCPFIYQLPIVPDKKVDYEDFSSDDDDDF